MASQPQDDRSKIQETLEAKKSVWLFCDKLAPNKATITTLESVLNKHADIAHYTAHSELTGVAAQIIPRLCDSFGLEFPPKSLTALAIDTTTQSKFLAPSSSLASAEEFESWVQKFQKSELSPMVKSADRLPNDRDPKHPNVVQLTANSFDELVINNADKNVLVDIWAEWCGPCVAIGPTINALANVLSQVPNVLICKLNCDANDVSREYFPEPSIPNIKFFPAGNLDIKKKPIKYQGDRSLVSFISFIHENMTPVDKKFDLEAVKALAEQEIISLRSNKVVSEATQKLAASERLLNDSPFELDESIIVAIVSARSQLQESLDKKSAPASIAQSIEALDDVMSIFQQGVATLQNAAQVCMALSILMPTKIDPSAQSSSSSSFSSSSSSSSSSSLAQTHVFPVWYTEELKKDAEKVVPLYEKINEWMQNAQQDEDDVNGKKIPLQPLISTYAELKQILPAFGAKASALRTEHQKQQRGKGDESVIEIAGLEHFFAVMEKAKQEKKAMILDFTAAWCGPCQKIKPVVHDLAEKNKDKVLVLAIDVDDNADLSEQYQVRAMPTFIAFDNSQNLVQKFEGADLDKLKTMFATVTK